MRGIDLVARNVSKSFVVGPETVRAVRGVSMTVPAGRLTCLYGASGSGKSTLMNLLAGLDTPDAGEILIGDARLSGMSEADRARVRLTQVGVVFQEHSLLGELTAIENVMIPLLGAGAAVSEARQEALETLARVGVEDLAKRRPGAMSGGQRQRVGIARALVGGRTVLLADEPTGALDSKNSRALFSLLRVLATDGGVCVLVVTHDPLGRDFAHQSFSMLDGELQG